jgi:hypothetical protein
MRLVHGGRGDDVVVARIRSAAVIHCGAGFDVVQMGYSKNVRVSRDCEKVSGFHKRYI